MHSAVSRAPCRRFGLQGLAQTTPVMSPLVRDVAGELATLHPGAPRRARIIHLEVLGHRFRGALAGRWQALQGSGPPPGLHGRECARAEPRIVCALHTVLSEGPRLLDLYDAQQAGHETPRMKPAHARVLQAESVDTWHWLLSQGSSGVRLAATYGASMDPALRDAFLGDTWRSVHVPSSRGGSMALSRMIDNRLRGQAFPGLSLASMLALRLYAHPDSGAFHLVRACADLRAALPGCAPAACVEEIPALVHEAARALHALPEARVWGTMYKGLQSRQAGPLLTGADLLIDRVYSVTPLEHQSYAGRIIEGAPYDQELQLTDSPQRRAQAVLIAAFHPVSTAPQGEALLLPGQIYRIRGQVVREVPACEGGSLNIVRLLADKVGDRRTAAGGPH